MKKLKLFFALMAIAVMAVLAAGCSKGNGIIDPVNPPAGNKSVTIKVTLNIPAAASLTSTQIVVSSSGLTNGFSAKYFSGSATSYTVTFIGTEAVNIIGKSCTVGAGLEGGLNGKAALFSMLEPNGQSLILKEGVNEVTLNFKATVPN